MSSHQSEKEGTPPGHRSLLASALDAWERLPANVRGAAFVITGTFTLIVMAALVKHLGQSLPAFEVLFVRFLAGLIVILPVVWRQGFAILHTNKLHLHMARGFVGALGIL